jgi:DNA-binding MarR family transcriptional regulator
MEKERARLLDLITNQLQRLSHSWKFSPEVWMDLDLTTVQLKTLFFIDFEGSTNFKNVASALGVTPPSVTGIVDRLVEQGLVSREEVPENRRMQVLRTTEKGKTLLNRLIESRRSTFSSMLEKLSLEDLSALSEIMSKMSGPVKQSKTTIIDEVSVDTPATS